jgi:hypothetical protein
LQKILFFFRAVATKAGDGSVQSLAKCPGFFHLSQVDFLGLLSFLPENVFRVSLEGITNHGRHNFGLSPFVTLSFSLLFFTIVIDQKAASSNWILFF